MRVLFLYIIFCIPLYGQVIISEIMYDLVGPDSPNEFVELFNSSETDSIDLTDWHLRDKYSTDDLVDSGYGLKIPPLSYGLIFEGDYDFSNGIYSDSIPEYVVLIKVDDSSLGNGLSTSDSLYLVDSAGVTIDSLGWADIAADGFSIEKVRLNRPNTPSNWLPCRDSLGTPGAPNSVQPFTIDGKLLSDSLSIHPLILQPDELAMVSVTVANIGLNSISGTILVYYLGEIINTTPVPELPELDTLTIDVIVGPFPSGIQILDIVLFISSDQDTSSNRGTVSLGVRYAPGLLTINEFLPQPLADQIEFVELVHLGSEAINVYFWRLADNREGTNYRFPSTIIYPGEYIVIASDSSLFPLSPLETHYLVPSNGFPSLNNSGDDIRLFDPFDTLIDSLSYTPDWRLETGRSMEKIFPHYPSYDPANWMPTTSPNGMTPGTENSATPLELDGSIIRELITFSPTFPEPTDSTFISIPITNIGATPFTASIFISSNDLEIGSALVASISMAETTNVVITIPPFVSGLHPLFFQLDLPGDMDLSNNEVFDTLMVKYPFGTIRLNEFMALPNNDQAEFVELVSMIDLEMRGWMISDNTKSPRVIPSINVSSGEYLVVAADSSLSPYMNPTSALLVPPTGFPVLNNSGDAIYLFDMTGKIIDSLVYNSTWPLVAERSTEKLRPEFSSMDIHNWQIATTIENMTPGSVNSVALFDIDGTIVQDSIRHIPKFPKPEERIKLFIPVANIGVTSFSGAITVEEHDEELSAGNVPAIAVAETAVVTIEIPALASGVHPLILLLDIPGDLNPFNNIAHDTIRVSYPFGTVVINEFLPRPDTTQIEFIELVSLMDMDMTGWAISDDTKNPKHLPSMTVHSNSYIVIGADYSLLPSIPFETIFRIPLEGFPTLNNSVDAIYLYDLTNTIIDSLIYDETWPFSGGRSSEKLRPEFSSMDIHNWQIATAIGGMTPGDVNSVALFDLDGTIVQDSIWHTPLFPKPEEQVKLYIPIANIGVTPFSGTITVEDDDEELSSGDVPTIAIAETIVVAVELPALTSGVHPLILLLDVPSDLNPFNNIAHDTVRVSYPFGTVVINEFLPRPDSTQTEFIELVSPIDLVMTGWAISDNTKNPKHLPSMTDPSNGYIVIGADSSLLHSIPFETIFRILPEGFPALNNSTDAIYLYDMTNAIIDSLIYDETWPIADGRSTEKFRPEFSSNDLTRWAIAVNPEALTPGQKNSVYFEALPKEGTINFTPNPFSPDGDGVDDQLSVQFKLPFEQAVLKLEIFDVVGRLIATPYWNVYVPQEGVLNWDGKRSNGKTARMGIYIMKVAAKNPKTGRIWEDLQTVVLAKKL